MIKKGSWVQVRTTILTPGNRAAGIPEDTAKTPMIMWVKGHLDADANPGDTVSVTTRSGRKETGELVCENPDFTLNYGNFIPELIQIGDQAKEILFGGER